MKCDCASGPRCESNRCCEDETGAMRAPAAWSILHPWSWSRGRPPRVLFYCDECWEAMKDEWARPITGIEPRRGASDFWRPSITEMVRHAAMEINRQDRVQIPENYTDAVIQFQMELMRRRGFRQQIRR